MIKRYNNKSLMLGVPGLLLQIVGQVIIQVQHKVELGQLISLVGTGLLIAGLVYYALAKGRSGWWGLCGFLSCIGLIILACLKDLAPNE